MASQSKSAVDMSKGSRICKKLVLQAEAGPTSVEYFLYLKVQLPHSQRSQIYPLLPDTGVKLKESIVHRLDASGGAPALSLSAAIAASHLNLPISLDGNLGSPPSSNDGRHTPTIRKRSSWSRLQDDGPSDLSLPKVSVSNFFINLTAPPLGDDDPTPQNRHFRSPSAAFADRTTSNFIITLHLETKFLSWPPRSPFSVRLPKPYCLNNYLSFSFSSEQQDLQNQQYKFHFSPNIFPRSKRRRASNSLMRPQHDSLDGDDAVTFMWTNPESDEDESEETISGSFPSCEALTVRWADPYAGNLVHRQRPEVIYPFALRAGSAESNIKFYSLAASKLNHFIPQAQLDGSQAYFAFQAQFRINDMFYPGHHTVADLYLEPENYQQQVVWKFIEVKANVALRRWVQGIDHHNQPSLEKKPSVDYLNASAALTPDQSIDEEEDLLNVAPPRGLSDTTVDFSFDRDATGYWLRRRVQPLSSSPSRTPLLSTPNGIPSLSKPYGAPFESSFMIDPEKSESLERLKKDSVVMEFDMQGLQDLKDSLVITLHGVAIIKPRMGDLPGPGKLDQVTMALPVLRTPSIPQHLCNVSTGTTDMFGVPDFVLSAPTKPTNSDTDGSVLLRPFVSLSQPSSPDANFDAEARLFQLQTPVCVVAPDSAAAESLRCRSVVCEIWPGSINLETLRMHVQLDFGWPTWQGRLCTEATLVLDPKLENVQVDGAYINSRDALDALSNAKDLNGQHLVRIHLLSVFEKVSSELRGNVFFSFTWNLAVGEIPIPMLRAHCSVVTVTVVRDKEHRIVTQPDALMDQHAIGWDKKKLTALNLTPASSVLLGVSNEKRSGGLRISKIDLLSPNLWQLRVVSKSVPNSKVSGIRRVTRLLQILLTLWTIAASIFVMQNINQLTPQFSSLWKHGISMLTRNYHNPGVPFTNSPNSFDVEATKPTVSFSFPSPSTLFPATKDAQDEEEMGWSDFAATNQQLVEKKEKTYEQMLQELLFEQRSQQQQLETSFEPPDSEFPFAETKITSVIAIPLKAMWWILCLLGRALFD